MKMQDCFYNKISFQRIQQLFLKESVNHTKHDKYQYQIPIILNAETLTELLLKSGIQMPILSIFI